MSTTIDNARYDMYIQEKLEDERKEVFEALKRIANSGNIDELVKNLEKLKGIYISDESIDNKNLDKVIDDINLEMPKLKEYIGGQFEKNKKSCEESSRKYFVYGLIASGLVFLVL